MLIKINPVDDKNGYYGGNGGNGGDATIPSSTISTLTNQLTLSIEDSPLGGTVPLRIFVENETDFADFISMKEGLDSMLLYNSDDNFGIFTNVDFQTTGQNIQFNSTDNIILNAGGVIDLRADSVKITQPLVAFANEHTFIKRAGNGYLKRQTGIDWDDLNAAVKDSINSGQNIYNHSGSIPEDTIRTVSLNSNSAIRFIYPNGNAALELFGNNVYFSSPNNSISHQLQNGQEIINIDQTVGDDFFRVQNDAGTFSANFSTTSTNIQNSNVFDLGSQLYIDTLGNAYFAVSNNDGSIAESVGFSLNVGNGLYVSHADTLPLEGQILRAGVDQTFYFAEGPLTYANQGLTMRGDTVKFGTTIDGSGTQQFPADLRDSATVVVSKNPTFWSAFSLNNTLYGAGVVSLITEDSAGIADYLNGVGLPSTYALERQQLGSYSTEVSSAGNTTNIDFSPAGFGANCNDADGGSGLYLDNTPHAALIRTTWDDFYNRIGFDSDAGNGLYVLIDDTGPSLGQTLIADAGGLFQFSDIPDAGHLGTGFTNGGGNGTIPASTDATCAGEFRVFYLGGNGPAIDIDDNGAHNRIRLQSGDTDGQVIISNGAVNISGDAGTTGIAVQGSSITLNGSVKLNYVAKTATYTATAADYLIDCTTGTFTIDLPSAVGITGRVYVVKNSGAGTITVDPNSGQTIDGSATATLIALQSIQIMSNGANWIAY